MSNQPAPKKAKFDLSHVLKPKVEIDRIHADQVCTIFNYFSHKHFEALESCCFTNLHDEYLPLQLRLLAAQKPHLDRLLKARQTYKGQIPNVKDTRKLAQGLRALAEEPALKPKTKDAVLYYEAVCFGHVYMTQRPTQPSLETPDWIGNKDPVQFFEQHVEASERHLQSVSTKSASASVSGPSILSAAGTSSSSVAFSSVPATLTPSAPVASALVASGPGKPEPHSDEYLQERVSSFIVSKAKLSKAVPWDQLHDFDSGLKELLERRLYNISSDELEYHQTPPGILLHGDQGTGKTAIVESFAAQHDLTLFSVSGSMHGALRGQSEKLIQYIFDAVKVAASTKPCILFFDEVDGLLGGSQDSSTAFEGEIKKLLGDLFNEDVRCFVFGATNNPWNINMANYGRRFAVKVHVPIPAAAAREQVTKYALSKYWHTVDDAGLQGITAATKGYSAYDIVYHVGDLASILHFAMAKAQLWKSMDKAGKTVYVPALNKESGGIVGKKADFQDAKPRPITAELLVSHFQSGKAKKTCSPEIEKQHREWNKKWAS